MKIIKKEISKNIFLLTFENQYEITSTLLRFQEYYESPKFQNKIFTLNEYKKWYTKQKGKFSYYSDWNGFNFPSSILKPFYDKKFNPLSDKEKKILKIFESNKEKYYVIGVHKKYPASKYLLRHETAHALFYLDPIYKKATLKLIKSINHKKLKNKLRKTDGYSKDVLNDEIQANHQTYFNKFCILNPINVFKFRKLFNKHLKKYNKT